ncbi:MAG: NAD(P)/FAD-dependent oxidoreductase [Saccharofermentanales bacterium]
MTALSNYCLVAVVGGGAAGMMAAIAAAGMIAAEGVDRLGVAAPVMLLEKSDRVGRKLLATGNGRCNLSNQFMTPDHFHGRDREFVKALLNRFSVNETLEFFRSLGLGCRTESNGRIYPYSLQAAAVLDLLRRAAERSGVETVQHFDVKDIVPIGGPDDGFRVVASDGRFVLARTAIVATGGMAAPVFGCDGTGYLLLNKFGHVCTPLFPAIVQVKTDTEPVRGLAGIKFDGIAGLKIGSHIAKVAAGEILFTDYGLSGPPILGLAREIGSALRTESAEQVFIELDFLPDMEYQDLLGWLKKRGELDPALELSGFLTGLVHKKIGQAIVKRSLEKPLTLARPAAELTDRSLTRMAHFLKKLPIRVTGTRGWTQAQVTAGGLKTDQFNHLTLESKLQPGLFAAGEILDIDGDCGGYNLQWAWTTGHVAGESAALLATGTR